MSNLVVSFDYLVIRPETLGSNIYVGEMKDIPIMIYKQYKTRKIKRVEFLEDDKDTIVVVLYDEEDDV